jgi:AAA15 family ATPase/GTPase
MKLKHARIQTFRSIVDSSTVEVESRLTVLVGKNEQGKTTFLRALASFDVSYIYGPNDLPNHLRAKLGEKSRAEIPIVTLGFVPDSTDRQRLAELVSDMEAVNEFVVTKYYDGRYTYTVKRGEAETSLEFAAPNITPHVEAIKTQVQSLRPKLAAHATRLPAFAPHIGQSDSHIDAFLKANFSDIAQLDNLVKTFATGLAALPDQDQSVQQDIDPIIKDIQAKCDAIKLVSCHA